MKTLNIPNESTRKMSGKKKKKHHPTQYTILPKHRRKRTPEKGIRTNRRQATIQAPRNLRMNNWFGGPARFCRRHWSGGQTCANVASVCRHCLSGFFVFVRRRLDRSISAWGCVCVCFFSGSGGAVFECVAEKTLGSSLLRLSGWQIFGWEKRNFRTDENWIHF